MENYYASYVVLSIGSVITGLSLAHHRYAIAALSFVLTLNLTVAFYNAGKKLSQRKGKK